MTKPTLEVSMIVKDGAATLGRALASVADRILVGDTGSTDETIAVALEAGAEVLQIPWEDDFSLARNRVLSHAECDWILAIDADEMLDPSAPARLEQLLAHPEADAYDVVRWNYMRSAIRRSGENPPLPNPGLLDEASAYPAYAISVNTRLFRRHPGVYFEASVHETVAHRLDALGLRRIPANFILHHLGQAEDDEAVRKQKNDFYHKLGQKKVLTHPQLSSGWFELGLSELEHYRRPAEALKHFEHAHTLAPDDPRNCIFSGICLIALGRVDQALVRLNEAYSLGSRSAVLFEALGDAHLHSGRYEQARDAYQQGGSSPLNAAKLGACETVLGAPAEGISRIRSAIDRTPDFAELYDILTAAAIAAGDMQLAAQSATERLQIGTPLPEHFQLAEELRQRALANSELM
ncbi:glycosyltransferase [Telmatobacter bradus]|uniref:glycosyltransferase n=1 Tax=Telmatobacter bradus TaxID=474953 RepID=UPI003B43A6DA